MPAPNSFNMLWKSAVAKVSNFLGGFADAAVLLPIIALLSEQAGFSSSRLLISAGILYIATALFFKIPMAVQPLKSISVSAIALGASYQEIRIAAFCLGLFCIALTFLNIESWAKQVPIAIIHQIQVGLGVLLITQGMKANSHIGILLLSLAIFMFPVIKNIPLMGLMALVGFVGASFSNTQLLSNSVSNLIPDIMRPNLILMLLLPQLALTLSNSVLGTRNACETYFGHRAIRVTLKNLLRSIGFGNCIMALLGGLPFCHGSGGVTAHVKAGATQAWSTLLFGLFLIGFSGTALVYPKMLMALLLITTGLFHIQLGITTSKIKLGMAAGLTLLTGNLLWVLLAAILGELISHAYLQRGFAYSQASQSTKED